MILVGKENQNHFTTVAILTALPKMTCTSHRSSAVLLFSYFYLWLFICAGLIATPRRNGFSDNTLEKLLMLKVNHYESQWLLTTTLSEHCRNASKLIWRILILKIILNVILIWNRLENSDFDFDFKSFLDRRFWLWFEIILEMILPITGNMWSYLQMRSDYSRSSRYSGMPTWVALP